MVVPVVTPYILPRTFRAFASFPRHYQCVCRMSVFFSCRPDFRSCSGGSARMWIVCPGSNPGVCHWSFPAENGCAFANLAMSPDLKAHAHNVRRWHSIPTRFEIFLVHSKWCGVLTVRLQLFSENCLLIITVYYIIYPKMKKYLPHAGACRH